MEHINRDFQGTSNRNTHVQPLSDGPPLSELSRKSAEEFVKLEARVKELASTVDAVAAFTSYALYRMVSMTKEFTGKLARPAPAAVELAAWILFPEFGKSTVRDGEPIQKIIDALEECGNALTFAEIFPELPKSEEEDELAFRLRLQSGIVRGSSYPLQIVQRIQGVLGPLEAELGVMTGIGPCHACDIVTAVCMQIEENVNNTRDRFRETSLRASSLATKVNLLAEEKLHLQELADELNQCLRSMEGDWVPTRSQVSARLKGGVSAAEWNTLSQIIGLTPVSRASLERIVEVQDYPLFFIDSERAFCVNIVSCFDAVFSYFDELARSTANLRDRYGHIIAHWMEETIEFHMRRLFPPEAIIRSACFPDPDNPGGETEADVVVIWGPFLVIAEAKGKRIPKEAFRGSLGKLKRAISDNIQDAFLQARRIGRILHRDGKIRFKERGTSRIVEVEQKRLRRVMPISVTLQHLLGIPTQLAVTQRLGLFKGNAYPWSVSIADFDVITRFAGSPDILLHYIERRTAHQTLHVGLQGDELDIFGQYFDNRLHPNLYESRKEIADHSGPRFLAFNGGEERFEAVYAAEWYGATPPSEPVTIKIPRHVEAILMELRKRSDDAARWVAFALLGLNQAALSRLENCLQQFESNLADQGRILRMTMHEEDVVINVLAHRGVSYPEFFKRLTLRSRLEHYRTKGCLTISFGIDQGDRSKPFEHAQTLEGPWQYDPIIEKILASERDKSRTGQMSASKAVKRNDPCPCGSGKKFKKCCIDRKV